MQVPPSPLKETAQSLMALSGLYLFFLATPGSYYAGNDSRDKGDYSSSISLTISFISPISQDEEMNRSVR